MAIQSSGQIEISEIAAEFGGSAPHALSEYYGGGDNVPQGANPGVPTSGEVQMADFYDAVAATVLTIGSNVANVNIKTLTTNAGGDQATPVILTIDSGVTVSSTSTGTPAMITDTGWSNGVTINIINNGSIVGASGADTSGNPGSGGGAGGQGGESQTTAANAAGRAGSAGSAGSGTADAANNGGDAFAHSQTANDYLSVIFDTAGTRTAGSAAAKTVKGNGGGGGGGGRSAWYQNGGGGGGGGAASGSGGGGHTGGTAGSNGGATSGGAGGAGVGAHSGSNTNCGWYNGGGGAGGAGGNLQASGAGGGSGGSRNNNCHGSGGDQSGGGDGSAGANGTANGSASYVLSGNTDQIS